MNRRTDIKVEIVIVVVEKIFNDGHGDKFNVFNKISFPCWSRHLKNFIRLNKFNKNKKKRMKLRTLLQFYFEILKNQLTIVKNMNHKKEIDL